MSTMHRNSNNTSSSWSSPKDNPLKRRHTRGNTSHSHSSSSIRSLSLSPAVSSVSSVSLSADSNAANIKASPGFKTNNSSRSQQQQPQQQQPHSSRRNTDFAHHDFSHHDLNSSYHDFHQQGDHNNEDKYYKSSLKSNSGGAASGGFVPSWFGSLRSFAISATSSSRGAFAPLNTSPSSSSSSSFSTTSSPTSSKSHSKKSRGRSSSIYYSSALHLHDSDDDSDSESSRSGQDDEPITDLNGLKENRVRGPRVNWMALDPSLGSFFAGAGGTYKPLSTNESGPDLSSSSCEEGEESAGDYGGQGGRVEELGISEAPYRDEESGDDEGRGGYGRSGSVIARASAGPRARARLGGDAKYRDDEEKREDEAWARAMDDANVPEAGFTMPVAAPNSTLAFLKSYVPTLGGVGGTPSESPTTTTTSSPTATSPTTTASPTSPAAVSGGGFWSLRKLSMNFLSGNQYAAVGDKSASEGEEEEEGDREGNESEDQYRIREQGRRAGYRDDYDEYADDI
ncbi:hypothetical protein BGW39_004775, partial [Mortierella sp. 14UC]